MLLLRLDLPSPIKTKTTKLAMMNAKATASSGPIKLNQPIASAIALISFTSPMPSEAQ
jgi:hypothetical protein